jgi:protein-tyrosine phosphatase
MESAEPPFGGPLIIDPLPVPGGGILGLVHCPGRNQVDAQGRRWCRNLRTDLVAIEAWGARTLVTLLEAREFARLGVPGFRAAVGATRLAWHHLPVADRRAPGEQASGTLNSVMPYVLERLSSGEQLVIHCAAGLGRTGALAAKLLVQFGVPPALAIERVRQVRPGSIESAEQEAWVLTGPPLPSRA